jgi:hypothetical protein
MNNKLAKILTIVTGVIGLIGFYYFVMIASTGDEAIENDPELQGSILDPFITFSTTLLIAVAVLTVLFSLFNLFKNPKALKRSLLGVAVLAVILAVAYSMASDAEVLDSLGKVLKDGEAGSVSKWVSTLINFSFILGAIGLVFFLLDFFKSMVK